MASISNISSSPELNPVNDAIFQRSPAGDSSFPVVTVSANIKHPYVPP